MTLDLSYFIASLFCFIGIVSTYLFFMYWYWKLIRKSGLAENGDGLIIFIVIFIAMTCGYYLLIDNNLKFAYNLL